MLDSHDRPSRPLRYEALSYTWGDSNVTDDILCNGCRLRVTTNLKAALRRLRFAAKSRRLWIDAICIHQDRYQSKCCRNLRFEPKFCEGVGFAHLACRTEKPTLRVFIMEIEIISSFCSSFCSSVYFSYSFHCCPQVPIRSKTLSSNLELTFLLVPLARSFQTCLQPIQESSCQLAQPGHRISPIPSFVLYSFDACHASRDETLYRVGS
jgi:hypothetical protein